MKYLNIIFIALFILFAAVQYNDPDPWLWMALYLYGAALCFFAARKKNYRTLNFLGIGVFSLYAVYLFFSESGVWSWITEHDLENIAHSMQATRPWIEKTREFFGLVILLLILGLNMIWLKKQDGLK